MAINEKYGTQLATVLLRYYQKLEGQGHTDPADKAYIDGFIEAAIYAEIGTKREIQDIIDRTHIEFFGQTIVERREARALSGADPKAWDAYERPAWKRKL